MKKTWLYLKPYLRWAILGGTLFFLAKTLKDRAAEVAAIRIAGSGWISLAIALFVTLLAHTWAGCVWLWILQSFEQPVKPLWVVRVYLKTNLAKYIPGSIWHYYGRVLAVKDAGGSLSAATASVLLEPLLMAAAACAIALLCSQSINWSLQVFGGAIVLLGVHPRILNPAIQRLSRLKGKVAKARQISSPEQKMQMSEQANESACFQIERYPLLPLLGELGFIALRGGGFLFVLLAVAPVNFSQIPLLLGAFSLAWLMGFLVPVAPGGMGIFEATAIALLAQYFSAGVILSVVALFRVVSILAEVAAAGLATLSERKNER